MSATILADDLRSAEARFLTEARRNPVVRAVWERWRDQPGVTIQHMALLAVPLLTERLREMEQNGH